MKKVMLGMFAVMLLSGIAKANQSNSLVLLNAQTKEETEAGMKLIEQKGGQVRHVFPPDVLIAYLPERMAINERVKHNPVISQIFHQAVDPATISFRSEIGIQGVKSWNYLLTGAGKVPPGIEEKKPSTLVGDAFPPINVLGAEDISKMTSSVG